MQKRMTGWMSSWLYMACALIFAVVSAITGDWRYLLHTFGIALLLIHAMVRKPRVQSPLYLISFEQIHDKRYDAKTTDRQDQFRALLIDLVPVAFAVITCCLKPLETPALHLDFKVAGALVWYFLCGYKLAVHFSGTSRKNVVAFEDNVMTVWLTIFALCFVIFSGIIMYMKPTLLEYAIPLVFVALVAAMQYSIAWLYLSPAVILLLVFTVWPIINTVLLSFREGYNSMEAVGGAIYPLGVKNFINVVHKPTFTTSLKNTILLCVLTVPISTLLALLIAVALNSIKRFQKILQTIFFLPYVTNSIAIGMVFAAMFNIVGNPKVPRLVETYGIINNVLGFFGADPINWINAGSEPWANIFVMVVYIVWNALPFKILVLLGGLQSVNKQYYDAAKVDSTPHWRVFSRITVPLLSPMIAYVVITGFIGGFKEYTSIVGVFGESMGPPSDPGSLNTMVGMVYDSITGRDFGDASAAALILFGIIMVVTFINLYVSKKRVHY